MKTIKKSHVFAVLIIFSFFWWIVALLLGGIDNEQFSIFFSRTGNLFADTLNVVGYSSKRDPYFDLVYGRGEKPYPAFTYCLMYLLSRICNVPEGYYLPILNQTQFLMVYVIAILFSSVLLYEIVRNNTEGDRRAKALLPFALTFSFPVLYTIERGSTLILTLICVMLFVFNYNSDNKVQKEIGLFALGIAAALKLTPAIFGLLLIYEKKWKEAARCIAYGVFMVFAPFFFLKRGFIENLLALKDNIIENLRIYTDADGCGIVASVYKYCRMAYGWDYHMPDGLHAMLRIITIIICVTFVASGFIVKKKWISVMGLSLINIILPSHSGTYNVIYLLPAVILFMNDYEDNKIDWVIMIFLIPIFWVHYDVLSGFLGYNFALPILSLLMMGVCIKEILSYLNLTNKEKAA